MKQTRLTRLRGQCATKYCNCGGLETSAAAMLHPAPDRPASCFLASSNLLRAPALVTCIQSSSRGIYPAVIEPDEQRAASRVFDELANVGNVRVRLSLRGVRDEKMTCPGRDNGVIDAGVGRGGPVRTMSASDAFKVDAERGVGHVFHHDRICSWCPCGLSNHSET
jgi:hypothetical protein